MGINFRLKWASPVHSRFLTSSSSSSSSSTPSKMSSSASSSSGRGREAFFNSGRLSFLSAIPEESPGASFSKDIVKAHTCSSSAPRIWEHNLLEIEELKINSRTRSQIAVKDINSRTTPPSCKESCFSMLIENLDVLEETFIDSNTLNLERNILLRLARLGALKLFNTCLSRTLETSSFLDLSDTAIDRIEENETNNKTNRPEEEDDIVIHSSKKDERKLRRERALHNSKRVSSSLPLPSKVTVQKDVRKPTAPSIKRTSKYRRRRLTIARNEVEMSMGVKAVAELERIRTSLEKKTGQVPSLRCWAEAAGTNVKLLQKNLHFGWHCRDELIRSTRPLILFLSRNYRSSGLSVEDLLQAGNVGVLQGAERFDFTRGYRFSTYVQYWIRKSMSRMVAKNSRGIQIPYTLTKAIRQIQKIRKAYSSSRGNYPDDDEISKLTGISLSKIKSASKCLRVVGSLDQKIGHGLNMKYTEFMADMSIKGPEESVKREHMRKEISDLLEGLDRRERQVLILRYGLDQPRSLEEIGKIFLVSKEWVRKIEKKAMSKLRGSETLRNLSHYMDS